MRMGNEYGVPGFPASAIEGGRPMKREALVVAVVVVLALCCGFALASEQVVSCCDQAGSSLWSASLSFEETISPYESARIHQIRSGPEGQVYVRSSGAVGKYDSLGSLMWQENNWVGDLALDSQGSLFYVYYRSDSDRGIKKLGQNSATVWLQDDEETCSMAIAMDADDHVYLLRSTRELDDVTGQFWCSYAPYRLEKRTASGNLEWEEEIDDIDWSIALEIDTTNGVYVVGSTIEDNHDVGIVTCFDLEGGRIFSTRMRDFYPSAFVPAIDGGFVVGNYGTWGNGEVRRYNAAGQWQWEYDLPWEIDMVYAYPTYVVDLAIDNVDRVIATGVESAVGGSWEQPALVERVVTTLLSSDGQELWTHKLAGYFGWAEALAPGGEGNVFVAATVCREADGRNVLENCANPLFVTFALNSAGEMQWLSERDDGSGMEEPLDDQDIVVGPNQKVCTVGTVLSPVPDDDDQSSSDDDTSSDDDQSSTDDDDSDSAGCGC